MRDMVDRRSFLAGAAALAAGSRSALADAPILTDDGLYKQPWFVESFLDLARGPRRRRARHGKRFAIMWELRGCPYCKETHLVNFAQPRISDYVKANFEVLQLNIIGSRKVTDFDGEELSREGIWRSKYGVRFTPTFQFFPERADGLEGSGAATQARSGARCRAICGPTISCRCSATSGKRPMRARASAISSKASQVETS